MAISKDLEIWFVTGKQHLYGAEAISQVRAHSVEIVASIDAQASIPVQVVFSPVATTPDEIRGLCRDASSAPQCIGLIFWMHTFSPAKMWIAGLSLLTKPFPASCIRQYNRRCLGRRSTWTS